MSLIERRAGAARIASPRLEIRDLRVVLAVAQAGTTKAASSTLHLTQSAVSRALSLAEERAGVPLFTRTPRGLVPTPAGAKLVDAAPLLLADLSELEESLRAPPKRRQRLRLVAECYAAYAWLTGVVLRLKDTMPDYAIELAYERSHDPGSALAEGEVDAAMLTSAARPDGTLTRALFADEILFVIADTHPAARKGHLVPADIEAHTMLATTARTEDAWFVRQVFGNRTPRVRAERLPITEAIVELVRSGAGIGVMSEWVAEPHVVPGSGLRLIRLRNKRLLRKWRLVYTRAAAPAVDVLASSIIQGRPTATLLG